MKKTQQQKLQNAKYKWKAMIPPNLMNEFNKTIILNQISIN